MWHKYGLLPKPAWLMVEKIRKFTRKKSFFLKLFKKMTEEDSSDSK